MVFDQQAYLAKYQRQMAKAQTLTIQDKVIAGEFVLNINPRFTIQAPKSKVLVSADYSSQEA